MSENEQNINSIIGDNNDNIIDEELYSEQNNNKQIIQDIVVENIENVMNDKNINNDDVNSNNQSRHGIEEDDNLSRIAFNSTNANAGPSRSSRSSTSNIVDWRAVFGTADDAEENEDFSFSIVTKNVFQNILNDKTDNSLTETIPMFGQSTTTTTTTLRSNDHNMDDSHRNSMDSTLFNLDSGDEDSEQIFNYCSTDHANRSFPLFLELWTNQQVCDVKLTLEGKIFHCHRIILCATIPYFYTMFTTDMVEKDMNDIILHSPAGTTIDTQAFGSILRYAYTGSICINTHNVHSLLIASNFLGLQNVQNACSEFLKRRLSTANVLALKSFAFTLGLESLLNAIDRYIYEHFEDVVSNVDFTSLQFNELMDILERDELNVGGESSVFEAIMIWTRHDPENRKTSLATLLQKVRFPLLSPEYIVDHVLSEPLIRNSLICRDLVDEAKDYHLLPGRRQLMKRFSTRSRYGHHVRGMIFAVGIVKNGELLSTVEVYDPLSKRWNMAESMSIHRSRVGVVVMDNKLYAIGGYNGQERLNTVEVYDCQTERWTRVTPMEHRRSAVGAAALDGQLYVCGGYNSSTSLNVVERYSPITRRWKEVAPMNHHRSAAGVVALDGYIYVLGGHDGMAIFDTVERYDPVRNRWEMVRPMNSKRCRLGVAAFGSKIYVCGGYDGSRFLKSVEVYDPNTAVWTYIQSMQVTRSRVALTANCGKLWAIGGYDGTANLSSVETYDVEMDRWQFVESMIAHEGGVGVGVIPNR